jgi:hypothetical protein
VHVCTNGVHDEGKCLIWCTSPLFSMFTRNLVATSRHTESDHKYANEPSTGFVVRLVVNLSSIIRLVRPEGIAASVMLQIFNFLCGACRGRYNVRGSLHRQPRVWYVLLSFSALEAAERFCEILRVIFVHRMHPTSVRPRSPHNQHTRSSMPC